MKTSVRGICAMLAEEAIVLSAYNDGTGTMTIGAGHTAAAGPPVPRSGLTITLTEAINIFRTDLAKFEAQVQAAVRTRWRSISSMPLCRGTSIRARYRRQA